MKYFITQTDAENYIRRHPYFNWLFGLKVKKKNNIYYIKSNTLYSNTYIFSLYYALVWFLVFVICTENVRICFFILSIFYFSIQAAMSVQFRGFKMGSILYCIPIAFNFMFMMRELNV